MIFFLTIQDLCDILTLYKGCDGKSKKKARHSESRRLVKDDMDLLSEVPS